MRLRDLGAPHRNRGRAYDHGADREGETPRRDGDRERADQQRRRDARETHRDLALGHRNRAPGPCTSATAAHTRISAVAASNPITSAPAIVIAGASP